MNYPHHIINALIMLSGCFLCIVLGMIEFASKRKTGWTLAEWSRLNGLQTLAGITACMVIYGLSPELGLPRTRVYLFITRFSMDLGLKYLVSIAKARRMGAEEEKPPQPEEKA